MAERTKSVGMVVPHTHWDREWRYPIWKNRMLLVQFVDRLLDVLENDSDYRCFVLDGQCVAVEDYLEVCPENTDRVRCAVQRGKLKIGPWYTLPDLYPLDGECLVRNLLKGIRFSNSFGGHLGVGYNSFGWGQTAQLPQIYEGFGFDFLIAAKRVDKTRAPHCEFWWEGPDGTRLLTTRLGKDARANGFFQAYIPIRFGKTYDSPEFRFEWGKTGQVMHRSNSESAHEDYFRLDAEQGYHEGRVESAFTAAWEAMDETLSAEYRLILCGSDFTTPQPILTRMIRDANSTFEDKHFELGTLEDYARELHVRLADQQVPVVRGELRDGPACDCSANALAVRMPIKQLNKRVENMLIRQAEPLACILAMLGQDYPQRFLDIAWKYLMQAHPHDSINGVTQDKTVDDTLYRLSQALEIGQVVFEQAVSQLIKRIDCSCYDQHDQLLIAVNPLPYPVHPILKACIDTPREANVWEIGLDDHEGRSYDTQFVGRREMTCPVNDPESRPWPFRYDRHTVYFDPGEVPAGGHKVFRVSPRSHCERDTEWWPLMRTGKGRDIARTPFTLENENLRIDVQSDGTFHLADKSTGRVLENVHYFEDTGDAGDYWAYYPPHKNQTFVSCGSSARIWLEDNGPLSATVAVEITMAVPTFAIIPDKSVRGDSRRSQELTPLTIISRLTLNRGAKRLDIHTQVDNTARDHRLCVMIPTDLRTDHADSAGHFHVDRRPIYPLRDDRGEFYPEMQTQPMQMFVDVSDDHQGLAVVSDSFTEYRLMDDDRRTLALTLFRAVRNRICSEKRSTADFPDQHGGQLLQSLDYHYALYLHEGDWTHGRVYEQAMALNCPTSLFQFSPGSDGTQSLSQSLFSLEPHNLLLTSLKKSEDRGTFIARVLNPTDQSIQGRLHLHQPIQEAYLTDLNELRQNKIDLQSANEIALTVKPKKILTVEWVV